MSLKYPNEIEYRGKCVWLLLSAAYCIINANSKWKVEVDELLLNIGFMKAPLMVQLFKLSCNGPSVALLAKVVDDILLDGIPATTNAIIKHINDLFNLRSICNGPGFRLFCSLTNSEFDDISTSIDVDYRPERIKTLCLSRFLCRDQSSLLNTI